MSEQQNVQTIQRAYDAYGRGDIDTILNMLSDTVEWITPGPSEIPTAGKRHGRKEVAEFFQTLARELDVQSFEAKQFIGQGDMVVVLGSYRYRVKANSQITESDWAMTFVLRDGLVTRFQEYADTANYLQAYRKTPATV